MDTWQQEIHERLLIQDVTAPAELAEALLEPVLLRLAQKYPHLRDPDLLCDAAIDALMSYIRRPAQFDPTKRSLMGFLVMAAAGDLRNALAKEKRRRQREIPLGNVELGGAAGKSEVGEENSEMGPEEEKLRQELPRLFKDPRDLMAVELMLSGERKTEAFAEILQLQHLPLKLQRREVKRHKDRLKKRLERYGKAPHRTP